MAEYRLFIAVELPQSALKALTEIQTRLQEARPVRWSKETQMHLTLQFLGNVPAAKANQIVAALEERVPSQNHPFELTVNGIGAFPNLKRPRVIWAGVRGETGRLQTLQTRVVEATRQIGFSPETRPFKAHLTLGRTDKRARSQEYAQIGRVIRRQQERIDHIAPFSVDHISLIRSQLKPAGAIYTTLAEIKLGH